MDNILVVKLSAIGDVIHALPVSYAIKETYPKAHLTWVVEPTAYDILTGNPYIDDIILFEKKRFRTVRGFLEEFRPFRHELRARKYDAALDLQGLFKSAVIVAQSGAKLRLGTANMREGSAYVSRPVQGAHAAGHIVERYLDVARALGCRVDEVRFPVAVSPAEAASADALLAAEGVREDSRFVVLAIGGQGVVDGLPRLVGLACAVEEFLVLFELFQDVREVFLVVRQAGDVSCVEAEVKSKHGGSIRGHPGVRTESSLVDVIF